MSEKEANIQDVDDQDIVDITQLINPFPGLRPFGIEESHLFFGREGQSDEVLNKLSENRFAAILGASGSGKSSLMYCGLIPTLYGGFMTHAGSDWKIVVTRPGGGPIDNLAESMLIKDKSYAHLGSEDQLIRKTIMSTVLRSSSLGLVEVVRQLKTSDHENVLILVDQFEELFRYRKTESSVSDLNESSAFVNLLLEAMHQTEESIYVAITMRSDFIGECAQFPALTQVINDSHYLIPQMTRDQKRIAIEGPVAVGGGKIAPRLTQQLLNDVGDNPDQLPILQHALMRTWTYWTNDRKEDEPLDIRHYLAIGGLQEALSQHANEAYDSLNSREKEICEVMFKALTERGSENQGIRRPTQLSTLSSIAGVSEDEVARVVERFREPGRSLLMPPYGIRLASDTVIDISHESLMRIWVRLKGWLDEESKAADMYSKLSESAARYQEGRAGLWQMPDLQLALNWREETKPTLVWGQRYHPAFERTMVFLETSEKAYLTEQQNREIIQKRQVKSARITAIICAIALVITLTLVIFAFVKANQATRALDEALKQEEIAKQEKKNADDYAKKAEDRAADAQREKENAIAAQAKADSSALLAIEREKDANLAKNVAQQATRKAKEEADNAREAERQARTERAKAEQASVRADQQRYQALAQSMAIKASNILPEDEDQAQLRALVARQAYLFYEEFKDEGKDYNGDIYAGIYNALQGVYEVEYGQESRGDSALNQYQIQRDPLVNKNASAARSVVYAKDGKHFYSANSAGEVIKWEDDTRNYEVIFQNSNIARVVNISPDEQFLALGTEADSILLFNLKNKSQAPISIKGHRGGTVFDLIFLPDNSGFISVGKDNRILRSDFTSSEELFRSEVRIHKIDLSPNTKVLAGGGSDGNVYLWDLTDVSKPPHILVNLSVSKEKEQTDSTEVLSVRRKIGTAVRTVRFSTDGRYLAYGTETGEIILWDRVLDRQMQPTLSGFRAPVTDIEFSPDNRLILGTSTNSQIRIWDLQNRYDLPIVLRDYKGEDQEGWVYDADFDPTGGYFITAAGDGNLRKYPTKIDDMAAEICTHITRGNMSENEWRQYVGEEIPYVATCEEITSRRPNE